MNCHHLGTTGDDLRPAEHPRSDDLSSVPPEPEQLETIAQEIRQPAIVIAGFVDLLKREAQISAEERERVVAGIKRQATRISDLVDNLMGILAEVPSVARPAPVAQPDRASDF